MTIRGIEAAEAEAKIGDNKFSFFITTICSLIACAVLLSGIRFGKTEELYTFLTITLGSIHFIILISIVFMSRVYMIYRALAIAMLVFYILTLKAIF